MNSITTPTLKCLIVDDEPDAHQVLKLHIAQISWLEVIATYYDGIEALTNMELIRPDIVFLDVQMVNLTGLELLSMLPVPDSQIILTTAYSEFAKQAYDFGVIDFLLKPVLFQRFLQAVNKARLNNKCCRRAQECDHKTSSGIQKDDWKELPSPTFTSSYVLVRVDKKIHHIPFEDIYFIQSLANYVNVQTRSGCLTTRGALSEFTNNLPESQFLRTHKSYIINRKHVVRIEGNVIFLAENFKVPMSRADRLVTLKWLAN